MDLLHSTFSYVSDCLHICQLVQYFHFVWKQKENTTDDACCDSGRISLCWELGPQCNSAETMGVF